MYKVLCTHFHSIDPAIAEIFADEMAEDEQVLGALNSLDWANNPMLATSLEESVTNTTSPVLCYSTENVRNIIYTALMTGAVSVGCVL